MGNGILVTLTWYDVGAEHNVEVRLPTIPEIGTDFARFFGGSDHSTRWVRAVHYTPYPWPNQSEGAPMPQFWPMWDIEIVLGKRLVP